jgi:hypothetical protein
MVRARYQRDRVVATETGGVRENHWRRRFTRTIAYACTQSRTDAEWHFILRFRCSGGASPHMARKKHTRPRCRPNSDTAAFAQALDIDTQITK